MSTISLSQQERDFFATWLEQQASSLDQMIEALEGLGDESPMSKPFKVERGAYLFVAEKLRSTEEFSVNSDDVS